MIGYLMFKDYVIADLDIDSYGFRMIKAYTNIFPVRSDAELHKWWSARQTPYNRDNIMDAYKYLGVSNFSDFVRVTHFNSVNDCWWVRTDSKQNWSNTNLYSNHFNKLVSDICFTGDISVPTIKTDIYSPEFSLGGSFPKTWRHNQGKIQLIKASRLQESKELHNAFIYNEVLLNQLEAFLGIEHCVQYNLSKYKDKDVCVCDCFTNESIMYYPAVYQFQGYPSYDEVRNMFGGYKLFYQMCFLDYLTLNIDRHTGNFGVLVNSENLEVIGMSPIFDNNYSLLPTKPIESLSKEEMLALKNSQVTRFDNISFQELGKYLLRDYPKVKDYCRKLLKFEFKPVGTISTKRLKRLSWLIRQQARELLKPIS